MNTRQPSRIGAYLPAEGTNGDRSQITYPGNQRSTRGSSGRKCPWHSYVGAPTHYGVGPASSTDVTITEADWAEVLDAQPEVNERKRERVPPLSTSRSVLTPRTETIGRESDIEAVWTHLTADRGRLVTVVGSPGVGKTRLAMEVACRGAKSQEFDGVGFVDLVRVSRAAQIADAIALEFDIAEQAMTTREDSVIDFLTPKRMLLCLDNCEHLSEGCAQVADRILGSCPHVRILTTSREALSVIGEHEHPVRPLSFPAFDIRLERTWCPLSKASKLFWVDE